MVLGWRRAFCTSIPKDDDAAAAAAGAGAGAGAGSGARTFSCKLPRLSSNNGGDGSSTGNSPRISSKFGFFSNPSTPRSQSRQRQRPEPAPAPSPNLRCRTAAVATPASSAASSPRLQCKTAAPKRSGGGGGERHQSLFNNLSNPSSPRSPSGFSLLKASLRLSRTRCGICLQSVKTGQGTAIFTAECAHTFHFPCVAAHVKKHRVLACPVCSACWKEIPLLDAHKIGGDDDAGSKIASAKPKPLRAYDDDESLLSPSSVSRFNPIPESDESNEDDQQREEDVEFQGFCVGSSASPLSRMRLSDEENNGRNVEVSLLPEAAVISANKSYGTCAVVLKVKAPPAATRAASARAPIDLVTVLDVSASMSGEKLLMMKRAMRLVISSLGETDRLSIVAFSTTSKRLLPLKRMTMTGRRSARRIVDAIGCTGQAGLVNDALRKAAKVLEDRRERNPAATIVLLSDGQDQRVHANAAKQRRNSSIVSSTRFGDIPVHAVGFCDPCGGASGHAAAQDESFARCLSGLTCVVVQDLKLQLGFISGSDRVEITAVYSLMGRPTSLGSGLIRVGDLFAEEERELLVELRLSGSHHVMSVGSSYRDPLTRELVYSREQPIPVPRPHAVRSSSPHGIQRLKNLHVTARAIAESRRLADRGDASGAYHLLSSARALLVQSCLTSADEFLRCLEAELAELQRLRQQSQRARAAADERREPAAAAARGGADEKPEPLTPTSAWRAAERLAKVAIMRKSMNRVSDLHGFENARF
ncbi:E3 ubiquitin-protein ligase WAVH1 [Eucalyptus grandis]|uniref:E3 ubiquitin-protein ligase WAVH1 n=1 Tax=Eucalyptus grandis TaxID=71139 RepID=UPI00192EB288|nr:E3 ubiquitin-protein ligase WAVH1 [Eucalyptus grandis]